jgi:hypothetical protein
LLQGSHVTVAQVDHDIFLVSPRPQAEVQRIAEQLPREAPSPFAITSSVVKGIPHDADMTRPRHSYSGPIEMPNVSDKQVLARAKLVTPRRRAR